MWRVIYPNKNSAIQHKYGEDYIDFFVSAFSKNKHTGTTYLIK